MSLPLQHLEGLYASGEYQEISETMREYEQQHKPFPECVKRELTFGLYWKVRNGELLLPIRFLWLFELNEQRLFGIPPLGRSIYHPEKLLQQWTLLLWDETVRQRAIETGVLLDLECNAISLRKGLWVWCGNTFIQDFFEIEDFYGEKLLFPDDTGELKPIFQDYRKTGGQHDRPR